MGCFLACFGSSKDRKRIRHRHKVQVQVQPRDNRNAGFKQAETHVFVEQKKPEIPSSDSVSKLGVKSEKQLSLSPRKKVTFDSSVTTYEHVSVHESIDFKEEEVEILAKKRQTQCSSEDSSVVSSSGSYPSNRRYQNCRDSDDELDYGESDYDYDDNDDDDDDDDDDDGVLDFDDAHEYDENLGLKRDSVCSLADKEVNVNRNARDRSGYVNSVLNPVENLTQWKAVKAKGTPPLKQLKENSFEPTFSTFDEKSDRQLKKSNHEIAVDASLSNWLGNRPSSTV